MRVFFIYIVMSFFYSCQNKKEEVNQYNNNWTFKKLQAHSLLQIDSSKWNKKMLVQDIELFKKYPEAFIDYPENKSPFPVTDYEYAVYSEPFIIKKENVILKGYRIGEYENFESDEIIDKLILLILTNDEKSEDATYVISRNYPYLTAEGYFNTEIDKYNWVFTASPDNYATLFINTKLFDLRFGKTIIIYPQKDGSIRFNQLATLPKEYSNFEDFKEAIINNVTVKNQLLSINNIKFKN